MRKLFLAVFCVISALFINSCGTESKIDTKILTQNKFEMLNPAFEYTLAFKEDKTYQVTYKGPSGTGMGVEISADDSNCYFYVQGEYELKENSILLHPKKYFDVPNGKTIDPSKAWGEAECTIVDKELNIDINGIPIVYTKYATVKISNVPTDFQTVDLGISGFQKNNTN